MFGKKVSSADYEEMSQKYLTYEAAYMNEKSRSDELKNEVLQLKQKLSEIAQNGIVAPGVMEKYNALAEENQKLKQMLNDSTDGEVLDSLKAQLEEALKTAKDSGDFSNTLLQALDAERAKTSELTSRLQNMPKGEKSMSEDLTQWEYKKFRIDPYNEDKSMEELNKLGKEGWEVVSSHVLGNTERTILKRHSNKTDYGFSR